MKTVGRVPAILSRIALVFVVAACLQCAFHGADKPAMVWTNYDLDEGLGAPAYSGKGFEPLPIVDGVLCNDIAVGTRGGVEVLWVGTNGPLMSSEDRGTTWQISEESLRSFQGPGLLRVDDSEGIWLATRCGVHHSADGGTSWTSVYDHPLWCSGINDMEIRGNTLWVAASEVCQVVRVDIPSAAAEVTFTGTEWIEQILPASDGSLYISTVSGIFRSAPAQQGEAFDHFYGTGVHKSFLEVDGALWCNDLTGNVKKISTSGDLLWQSPLGLRVLKSAPGGVIWGLGANDNGAVLTRIDTRGGNALNLTELGVSATSALHVDELGTIYISLPGEIAYSSDEGQTWTHRVVGISTLEVIAAKDGHAWAGISGIGASRFLPSGDRWETVSGRFPGGIDGGIDGIYMRSPSEVFLSLSFGAVVGRTNDGGATFAAADYDVSAHVAERSYGCKSICETSSGRLYVISSAWSWDHLQYWINLYSSDDDGEAWSPADCVYYGSDFPRWPELAVDETRNILWVTCELGLYQRSLDGGAWQVEPEFGWTESPFVDANATVYVVGEGSEGWGLYFLESGRADWGHHRLPDGNCHDTSLVVDLDGDLWFGSDTGVHYSNDGGATWATYTKADGLASTHVCSLAVDGSGDSRVLWVGTILGASRGVIVAP